MRKTKILFLIHDLGQGGAEKVLVNLVNNMDRTKFDITVMTLFDWGVNKQFLNKDIKYKHWCSRNIPGNSHWMKLLSPKQLHKLIIKEKYDIEVSYLEGPCARVISGCPSKETKLISWIHIEQRTKERATASFRSYNEAIECYSKFDKIVGVSKTVLDDFKRIFSLNVPFEVLYNTNETKKIIASSKEEIKNELFKNNKQFKMVGVGKLLKNKGFDRILKIVKRLKEEEFDIHLYVLGIGPEEESLKKFIKENKLENNATLLGYDTNPYKYVSNSDLFVCASFAEGFSTAATEALIVGTPVCTVEVSGMKEMLGYNNEYGVVVNNDDESLYEGIKSFVSDSDKLNYYKQQAVIRGKFFSTEKTVDAVEEMLLKEM